MVDFYKQRRRHLPDIVVLVEVLFLAEAADVSPPHGDGAGAADDDDDEEADGEREHRHHGHRVADGEARRGPQHAAAVVHHEQVAALVRPLHLPHLQPRRVAVLDEMLRVAQTCKRCLMLDH